MNPYLPTDPSTIDVIEESRRLQAIRRGARFWLILLFGQAAGMIVILVSTIMHRVGRFESIGEFLIMIGVSAMLISYGVSCVVFLMCYFDAKSWGAH